MEFFLEMEPPTKTYQEHRVGVSKYGKPYFYEDKELKQIRAMYKAALSPFAPEDPIFGPVELSVEWRFRRNKKQPDMTYKITKPDTDNLNKMLKDEMTAAGFWKDDAQVASEIIKKFWAEVPGIKIKVVKL